MNQIGVLCGLMLGRGVFWVTLGRITVTPSEVRDEIDWVRDLTDDVRCVGAPEDLTDAGCCGVLDLTDAGCCGVLDLTDAARGVLDLTDVALEAAGDLIDTVLPLEVGDLADCCVWGRDAANVVAVRATLVGDGYGTVGGSPLCDAGLDP